MPAGVAALYAACSLLFSTSMSWRHALTYISLPVGTPQFCLQHINWQHLALHVSSGSAWDVPPWPAFLACMLAGHTCCLHSAPWQQQALLVSLGRALPGTCLLPVLLMLPAVCLIEGTLLFLPFTVVHKVQNASDTLFRYEVG